jgi:Uncharacterised nucleotidyltransferase
MTHNQSTSGSAFRLLCRVLGGQDPSALKECMTTALLPQMFSMAHSEDLLPALSVRCNEQDIDLLSFGADRANLLRQALIDNTRGNMEMIAQALKFTRELNRAGITPLFLKGTARLLSAKPQNLGFRKQVDVDLIVQPAELEAACETFLAAGYRFCHFPDSATAVPIKPGDAVSALKLSAAHHHLPPLVKGSYAATVELHRHFLPRRFQRNNPLEPLFASAKKAERHGATFYLPSTDYQLIHLLLGKVVHDGHLTRRTFPVREACDLIELLENAGNDIDQRLVLQRCGRSFTLFHALVCELMRYTPRRGTVDRVDTSRFTRIMQKRLDSRAIRRSLDIYARAEYLAHALVHSPAKLPAYLRRIV